MSFSDYIKNALVKFVRERYRYGFSHTLFVSEIFGCHLRAYLDRIYSAIPPLTSLEKMYMGIVWEKLVGEALSEKFNAVHEPELMAEYTIGNDLVHLLGHPDFVTEKAIIEVKSTHYTIYGVRRILSSVNNLLFDMIRVAPSLFSRTGIMNLLEGGREPPIFRNWIAQVNTYNYLLSQRPKFKSYVVVIYSNDIVEEDVTDFFRYVVDDLKKLLPVAYVSVSQSSEKFRPSVINDLLRLQMYYNWVYASYQCRTCPYYEMGVCRGIPPIRGISYLSPSDHTYRAIKTWYEYFGSKGDNFAITNGTFDFNKLLENLFGDRLREGEDLKSFLERNGLTMGTFLGIIYQDIYCRFSGKEYPQCIQSPPIELPEIRKEVLHRMSFRELLSKYKRGGGR